MKSAQATYKQQQQQQRERERESPQVAERGILTLRWADGTELGQRALGSVAEPDANLHLGPSISATFSLRTLPTVRSTAMIEMPILSPDSRSALSISLSLLLRFMVLILYLVSLRSGWIYWMQCCCFDLSVMVEIWFGCVWMSNWFGYHFSVLVADWSWTKSFRLKGGVGWLRVQWTSKRGGDQRRL